MFIQLFGDFWSENVYSFKIGRNEDSKNANWLIFFWKKHGKIAHGINFTPKIFLVSNFSQPIQTCYTGMAISQCTNPSNHFQKISKPSFWSLVASLPQGSDLVSLQITLKEGLDSQGGQQSYMQRNRCQGKGWGGILPPPQPKATREGDRYLGDQNQKDLASTILIIYFSKPFISFNMFFLLESGRTPLTSRFSIS